MPCQELSSHRVMALNGAHEGDHAAALLLSPWAGAASRWPGGMLEITTPKWLCPFPGGRCAPAGSEQNYGPGRVREPLTPDSDGEQSSQLSLFVGLVWSNTCRYFKH